MWNTGSAFPEAWLCVPLPGYVWVLGPSIFNLHRHQCLTRKEQLSGITVLVGPTVLERVMLVFVAELLALRPHRARKEWFLLVSLCSFMAPYPGKNNLTCFVQH